MRTAAPTLRDDVARAAGELGALGFVPRHAHVEERGDVDRNAAVLELAP